LENKKLFEKKKSGTRATGERLAPVRAGVAGLLALRLWGMRFVLPTLSSLLFSSTLIRLYISILFVVIN
jgi:hypothetical protein